MARVIHTGLLRPLTASQIVGLDPVHKAGGWGKRRAMRISPAPRRRKSPLPFILIGLLVLLIGFLFWLSTRNSEVPTQRIEQDVTNEALAH